MVTVVAARVAASGVPRVRVVVSGLDDSGLSAVTLRRRVAGSDGPLAVVQGAWRAKAAGSFAVVDFTIPLGVEIRYSAWVEPPGGDPPFESLGDPVRVDDADMWLQDPLAPRSAVPVAARWDGERLFLTGGTARSAVFASVSDVVAVEGSALPVVSAGTRQAASALPLALTAPAGLFQEAHSLLMGGSVLVLRGFDHPLMPLDGFLMPGDVKAQVLGYGDAWARWDAVCRVVAQPSPVVAVPWFTLGDAARAAAAMFGPGATIGQVSDAARAQGVTIRDAAAWLEAGLG